MVVIAIEKNQVILTSVISVSIILHHNPHISNQ